MSKEELKLLADSLIQPTGMKLKPLGELLGVSYDTIRSYSQGRLPIPAEKQKQLKAIARKLKG